MFNAGQILRLELDAALAVDGWPSISPTSEGGAYVTLFGVRKEKAVVGIVRLGPDLQIDRTFGTNGTLYLRDHLRAFGYYVVPDVDGSFYVIGERDADTDFTYADAFAFKFDQRGQPILSWGNQGEALFDTARLAGDMSTVSADTLVRFRPLPAGRVSVVLDNRTYGFGSDQISFELDSSGAVDATTVHQFGFERLRGSLGEGSSIYSVLPISQEDSFLVSAVDASDKPFVAIADRDGNLLDPAVGWIDPGRSIDIGAVERLADGGLALFEWGPPDRVVRMDPRSGLDRTFAGDGVIDTELALAGDHPETATFGLIADHFGNIHVPQSWGGASDAKNGLCDLVIDSRGNVIRSSVFDFAPADSLGGILNAREANAPCFRFRKDGTAIGVQVLGNKRPELFVMDTRERAPTMEPPPLPPKPVPAPKPAPVDVPEPSPLPLPDSPPAMVQPAPTPPSPSARLAEAESAIVASSSFAGDRLSPWLPTPREALLELDEAKPSQLLQVTADRGEGIWF